jgi:hypothetical protein
LANQFDPPRKEAGASLGAVAPFSGPLPDAPAIESRSVVQLPANVRVAVPATKATRLDPIPPHDPSVVTRTSSQPPRIRVTIGRIDVRAVFPSAATAPARVKAPSDALSLEDYLQQRSKGER